MSVCNGRIPALLIPALLSINGESGTGPLGCRVVVIPPRNTGTDESPDEPATDGIGVAVVVVVVGAVVGAGVMNGTGVVVEGCSGCCCTCCCSC